MIEFIVRVLHQCLQQKCLELLVVFLKTVMSRGHGSKDLALLGPYKNARGPIFAVIRGASEQG